MTLFSSKDGQLGVCRISEISLYTRESKWSITALCFRDVFEVTHALVKPSTETPVWNEEEEPSIQGHIRYPATLMVKRPGEKRFKVEKEF